MSDKKKWDKYPDRELVSQGRLGIADILHFKNTHRPQEDIDKLIGETREIQEELKRRQNTKRLK